MAYVPPHRRNQAGAGAAAGGRGNGTLSSLLNEQGERQRGSGSRGSDGGWGDQEQQRNGFLAVMSESFEEVQMTVQRARNAAIYRAQVDELPTNHYHFTVAIKLSTLQSLKWGTEDEKERAKLAILENLGDEINGVVLQEEMINIFSSEKLKLAYPYGLEAHDWHALKESPSDVHFKIKHHLQSILFFSQRDSKNFYENKHIMVIGKFDGAEFELDLPGGRRWTNPDESTLECVLRATRYECSLDLDKEWMADRLLEKYGGSRRYKGHNDIKVIAPGGKESMNAWFVMNPPPL